MEISSIRNRLDKKVETFVSEQNICKCISGLKCTLKTQETQTISVQSGFFEIQFSSEIALPNYWSIRTGGPCHLTTINPRSEYPAGNTTSYKAARYNIQLLLQQEWISLQCRHIGSALQRCHHRGSVHLPCHQTWSNSWWLSYSSLVSLYECSRCKL